MNYLNESMHPVEFKIAVINELGWDFNGKDNSTVFYEYLKEKRPISINIVKSTENLTGKI